MYPESEVLEDTIRITDRPYDAAKDGLTDSTDWTSGCGDRLQYDDKATMTDHSLRKSKHAPSTCEHTAGTRQKLNDGNTSLTDRGS